MNIFFLRFMEWVHEVLVFLFDQFLAWLSLIRLLEIMRRDLGEA